MHFLAGCREKKARDNTIPPRPVVTSPPSGAMVMEAESIYSLIPQQVSVPSRPPMYRSKHPPDMPATFSTFGLAGTSKPGFNNVGGTLEEQQQAHSYVQPHATFGLPNGASAPNPGLPLSKGSGRGGGAVLLADRVDKFSYGDTARKPPVPSRAELEASFRATLKEKESREVKNFVTSNAVENILSAPPHSEWGTGQALGI